MPKSTQVTARRATHLPGNNGNNTLNRPKSTTIKTPSIRASATANQPTKRNETLTNARKGASSNVKCKPSLVKPVPLFSLNVSKNKILQPSQSTSLTKNNVWSKTAGPRIKTTGSSQKDKNNVSTDTKLPTRLTRVNPNLNRPLRSMVTPAQKTQKPVARGISKINTISSARRRQTVALKDIQARFKPNPVSLQEILSSKTSRDMTMKRQSLASSKLGSINSAKPSIGSSRSRMTYSYRVEKPRESRASIFSGALRVPKNGNIKRDSRNTLIGKAVSSRTLSTIRELPVHPSQNKPVKKSANQSRGASRLTMQPAQSLSISALRRKTTSIIGEKQISVTGASKQQNQSVQNSATVQEVPSIQQIPNVQQIENPVKTVESLIDPLRRMSIHRFSRKSLLMNENTSSRPMNTQETNMQALQRRVSFVPTSSTSSKVVNEVEVNPKTRGNDSQHQNTRCLSQIKDQVSIRLLNNDQETILKSAVKMRNGNLFTLATSIPLLSSPTDNNEKGDVTKGLSNNNNFSSDVEKARLYEELEELEKQLEQEISEDMSEIL
ncbi:7813_t:CDS:2 [Rhizophagus irregularis]|nr:7813_t:CDS:2 [Rhizophagus irregularis]